MSPTKTNDELIRKYMTIAGTLMRDASAKATLEPFNIESSKDLRDVAATLTGIADIVDTLARMRP